MQAIGLPVRYWYTPPGEPEGGTRFLCRTLDERERAQVFMQCEREGAGMRITHAGLMFAIDAGLVGWENFTDEAGASLQFLPQNVARIPAPELVAMANDIINNSALTEEEKKKLSTPSK